jgi:hypothetical protein
VQIIVFKKLTEEEIDKLVIEYKKGLKDFSNLKHFILSNVELTNDELREVGLNNVWFTDSDLNPVDLTNVDLTCGVYLLHADLTDDFLANMGFLYIDLIIEGILTKQRELKCIKKLQKKN